MAENKILDDLTKFGNSTLSAVSGAQRQMRKWASEQFEYLIESMELVNKKDLEVLSDRIVELEKRLAAFEKSETSGTAKPAAEKPAAAKATAPKAKKAATAKKAAK